MLSRSGRFSVIVAIGPSVSYSSVSRLKVHTPCRWFKRLFAIVVAGIVAVGCGGAAARPATVARPPALAHWTPYVHVTSPIDVVGPRADGAMVVAANGRLRLLTPSGKLRPFAKAYNIGAGPEAYIALARAGRRGCSFGADTVYAISFASPRGVVAISRTGRLRPFATLATPGLIDGIAFDDTGHFGYRLLVATTNGRLTTVDAIDCHGKVRLITRKAHRVEGGIAVAPPSFGRFAGDLIESDELGGGIYAVTPNGGNRLVAYSDLPHGGDTGVESEAFLPTRALRGAARRSPDAGESASGRQRAVARELGGAVRRRRAPG